MKPNMMDPNTEPAADANEPADQPGQPDEQEPTSPDQGGKDSEIGDSPNVSPDEQKMYDSLVTACLNQIFGDDSFHIVVKKLQGAQQNISGAIGHTGAMILMSVKGSLEKQGKTVPDDVLYAASEEVVTALMQIAIGAKLMSEQQEKAVGEAAMYEGMRVWGDNMQKTKGITADVQGAAQQDLADAGVETKEPAGAPAQGDAQAGPPQGGGIVNQAVGAQQ